MTTKEIKFLGDGVTDRFYIPDTFTGDPTWVVGGTPKVATSQGGGWFKLPDVPTNGAEIVTTYTIPDQATTGLSLAQLQAEATSASELSTALATALAPIAKTADLSGIQGAVQGEIRTFNGVLPSGWSEVAATPSYVSGYGITTNRTYLQPRAETTCAQYNPFDGQVQCVDQSNGDVYVSYVHSQQNTKLVIERLVASSGVIETFQINGSQSWNTSSGNNGPVMVCDSTYLYLIGGYTSVNLQTVYRIHKTSKVITQMANHPITMTGGTAVWDGNDKIYTVGGTNGAYNNSIRQYVISTNTWTTKTATQHVSKSGVGLTKLPSGKIIFTRGYDGSQVYIGYQIYDPSNDTISAYTTCASKGITEIWMAGPHTNGSQHLCCVGGTFNEFYRCYYNESNDTFTVDYANKANEFGNLNINSHPGIASDGTLAALRMMTGAFTLNYNHGTGSVRGLYAGGWMINKTSPNARGFILGKKD